MKKTVLSILVAVALLAGQMACSAASYFDSFDSVTYVGEPSNVELEALLRQIAEDTKKAVEENPNLVFYVPEKGAHETQSSAAPGAYYNYYGNKEGETSLLIKYFASR